MSIKALKAHLVTKPEKQLLQEIVKLYQQFSVVRDFYDSQISTEGANDVLSKYKKIIRDEFLPKHGFGDARLSAALVMGPSLTDASQSGSIEVLQQFGNGKTLFGVPPMWNGIVDVRDVADAHVAAALNPQAHGRYIICGGTLSLLEMGKALTQKFGYKYPFPHFTVPKAAFSLVAPIFGHSRQFVKLNMGYPIYFNAQRSVNELGIEYRDIRESVCEHFQQLLDDGIVKKRA